jgi:hypothetical protein
MMIMSLCSRLTSAVALADLRQASQTPRLDQVTTSAEMSTVDLGRLSITIHGGRGAAWRGLEDNASRLRQLGLAGRPDLGGSEPSRVDVRLGSNVYSTVHMRLQPTRRRAG